MTTETQAATDNEPEILYGDKLRDEARDHIDGNGLSSRDTEAGVEEQSINESKMTADFTVVTRRNERDVNRNGNMVQILPGKHGQGLKLGDYQKNPIVLLNHGERWPHAIGLALDSRGNFAVKPKKQSARSTISFRQGNEWGEFAFASVAEGYMRMTSIAYAVHKAMRLEDLPIDKDSPAMDWNAQRRWFDFVESELWEISVVDIGADRGAFRQSLEKGTVGQFTLRADSPLSQYVHTLAEDKPAIGHGFDQAQLDEMKQKVDELTEVNATLKQRIDELEQAPKLEWPGGEITALTTDPAELDYPAIAQQAAEATKQELAEITKPDMSAICQAAATQVQEVTVSLGQRLDKIEQRLDYAQGRV